MTSNSIGIVVSGISHLKVLRPIIEMISETEKVTLICFNGKTTKGYDLPRTKRLEKVWPQIRSSVHSIVEYKQQPDVVAIAKKYGIKKIVVLEASLVIKLAVNGLYDNGVKIYSIQYLTDSMWETNAYYNKIRKIYFTAKYIMDCFHKFSGIPKGPQSVMLGSPLFDSLYTNSKTDSQILMLPNIRAEHIGRSFEKASNLERLVNLVVDQRHTFVKSRKKHWISPKIQQYCNTIHYDEDLSILPTLMNQTQSAIMFMSSGIYEAVISRNYVVNIPLSYKMFRHKREFMQEYFSNIYNFTGVSETIQYKDILNGYDISQLKIDEDARTNWVEKFVGYDDCNASKRIVESILGD